MIGPDEIQPSLWSALRNRPFALLWAGKTISQFGDSLYRIALIWWVLSTTGSGVATGAVATFTTVFMLAFLLFGGVVGDRFTRARVLLVFDLLRGVVTGAVAVLAFASRLDVWHIYAAAAVFGLSDAFVLPAYAAIVPQVVRRRQLPSANALNLIGYHLAGTGGPAVAALLVVWAGTSVTFAIESLSFFVAAACILPALRASPAVPPVTEHRSTWRDVREGIAVVTADPWLWVSIVTFAFSSAIDQSAFTVTLPFLIKNKLHHDVGAFGIVQACYGIGSVIGVSICPRLRLRGVGWYAILASLGLCMVCFGLPITIFGIAATALIRGVGFAIMSMIWVGIVQRRVPHEKLGRVSSIDWFGSEAMLPVGFTLAGWLTDHVNLTSIFVIGGLSVTSIALAGLAHPRIRAGD